MHFNTLTRMLIGVKVGISVAPNNAKLLSARRLLHELELGIRFYFPDETSQRDPNFTEMLVMNGYNLNLGIERSSPAERARESLLPDPSPSELALRCLKPSRSAKLYQTPLPRKKPHKILHHLAGQAHSRYDRYMKLVGGRAQCKAASYVRIRSMP